MIKLVLTSDAGSSVEWSDNMTISEFEEIQRQYDLAMQAVLNAARKKALFMADKEVPINK